MEICSLCIGYVLNGEGDTKDIPIIKSHQTKRNESHSLVLSAHLEGIKNRYLQLPFRIERNKCYRRFLLGISWLILKS